MGHRATLLLAALLALAACSKEEVSVPPPIQACVDADQDGIDSCADCDDADAERKPGLAEKCGDGKDNDCNGKADDTCQPGTDAGQPPGADAGQPGSDAGQPGPDAGACGDTSSDPNNCGQCGKACPIPANALVRCEAGVCGRAACNPGFFDLDGTFGCESACVNGVCTNGAGQQTTITSDLIPESGLGQSGFYAGPQQPNQGGAAHGHAGTLGEPAAGAVEMKNANHVNRGGFHRFDK